MYSEGRFRFPAVLFDEEFININTKNSNGEGFGIKWRRGRRAEGHMEWTRS